MGTYFLTCVRAGVCASVGESVSVCVYVCVCVFQPLAQAPESFKSAIHKKNYLTA